MSKKDQFDKNIKLSEKLADYIANHPSISKKHGTSSYVVFIEGDDRLNEMNKKLLENIKKDDKDRNVVAATLTKDKKDPWKFGLAY